MSWKDDYDEDARREAIDERRRNARMNHWCDVCLGNTGPGSPCAPEDDEAESAPGVGGNDGT